MKNIKIVNKRSLPIVNRLEGDIEYLPDDSEKIRSFIFHNEFTNETRYIIELSPDINNPLNFDGINFGLKIYFKHLQNNLLNFEIILFGFDSKEFIHQNCDYSFFLKCPNIFYKKIELNTNWQLNQRINPINKKHGIETLKKIGIKAPTSYKTHHSIVNEWSIFRWSRYLGIEPSLSKEISNTLFFEYLKTIYNIVEAKTDKALLKSKGNLLLIDDEEDKGWSEFFLKFRSNLNNNSKFESIGKNFKQIGEQDKVIEEIKLKITEFKPDVVILDLRLIDSDFDEKEPEKLTGYKVLEIIKKEINKGIQVILFTASNKIWNYQTLSIIGFDGWIIKESPELSTDSEYTIKAIQALNEQIDKGVERAKFLKVVYSKIKKLEELIISNQIFDSIDDTLRNKFLSNFEISFDLLYKATQSKEFSKYYSYAYLQLFLCVEEFLEIKLVFEKGDKCYVNQTIKVAEKIKLESDKDKNLENWKSILKYNKEDKEKKTPSYFSIQENISNKIYPHNSDFRMSCILIFLFNQENSKVLNWPKIRDVRNEKVAHPKKGNVTQSEINEFLEFLEFIFNRQNIFISKKKGLSDEISDVDINRLKEIFGGTN